MPFLYLFLVLVAFIILSPILVAFLFVYLTKTGFNFLEFSSITALVVLLLMLVASFINIPLSKKKVVEVVDPRFSGFFYRTAQRTQGVSINVGGALIPLLIVGYFLPQLPHEPLIITTGVVAFFAFLGARFVEAKGVMISMILPVLFAAFFAVLLAPEYAAQVAFSSGVLGVLIGADLLYLPWILKKSGGNLSIGGAGIFDGIFLVGIASALLTAI